MIKRSWPIIVCGLLGFLTLLNQSGYSKTIDSNGKTLWVLIVLVLLSVYIRTDIYKTKINKSDAYYGIVLFAVLYISSYRGGQWFYAVKSCVYFLCIYIVSHMYLDDKNMNRISWVYCVLSTGILAIANFGSKLDGWNANSLALTCLQLYLVFILAFEPDTNVKKLFLVILVILDVLWLDKFDSRGAQLSAILGTVLMFKNKRIDKLLQSKVFILVMLFMPFIVAYLTVKISYMDIAISLNDWSLEHFDKSIFNGRDEIWRACFHSIDDFKWFGHGWIDYSNFHNAAICMIYAYGYIGYILYTLVFYKIIIRYRDYAYDNIVRRCIMMFFVICIQQSTENSLFDPGVIILIPFVILGILIGRSKYLQQVEDAKKLEQEKQELSEIQPAVDDMSPVSVSEG